MKSLKFLKVQKKFFYLSWPAFQQEGILHQTGRGVSQEGVTLYFKQQLIFSFTEAETTLSDGAACTTASISHVWKDYFQTCCYI